MKKDDVIQEKSYAFSLQVVNLCRNLAAKHNEYVLTKQLLRSGTSIGANIQEASSAQSRPDFISKFSIALKEAKESVYWLRLIKDSQLASESVINPYIDQCNEIIYILAASIKTARTNSQ